MNRTFVCNFQDLLTLLIGQITALQNLSFDPLNKSFFGFAVQAILGMDFFMHQSHPNRFERPLFSVGLHPDSHGGMHPLCEQKFKWIWTGIAAADLDGFVGLELVSSD